MASQGICKFSGVQATAGWDMTYDLGVEPSTCVITTLESLSRDLPKIGTLVLEQDGRTITFPKCRVASRTVTSGRGGTFVKLAIKDRRWAWAFSQIDGSYNVRKSLEPKNVIRKKTPQELATLLWEALGESEFDVSLLPSDKDVFPRADWQGVPAAPLLSELCDSLGCVPYLDPATNRAKIAKIGEGRELPSGGRIVRQAKPTQVQAMPDQIRYVTGPALFQARFDLEPVGIDVDGEILPVDDLSYKPSEGWHSTDPYSMFGVEGTYKKDGEILTKRDLAKSSVWRMYRVTNLVGAGGGGNGFSLKALEGSGYETDKLKDFLPLRDTRLTTFTDKDGEEKEQTYLVRGLYALPERQAFFTGEDNSILTPVPEDWSRLDRAKGIVLFNKPMFYWGTGNKVEPATLALTTSFFVNKDGVKIRHEEFRSTPGDEVGTGPLLIRRPDTKRKLIEDAGKVITDNAEEIKKEADYYVDQKLRQLEAVKSHSVVYSRIVQWSVDGLTRQVTWSGGGGRAAFTQVSVNGQHNPYVPKYEDKVEAAKQKKAAEESEFLIGFNRDVFEGGSI